MKKVFIHFKSNVLFSLNINGEFISTTKNTNQTIDILTNTNAQLFFTYTPISNSTTFLPYSQNIEIVNGNITNYNDSLEIISFSNNHYLCNLKAIPIASTKHSLITKNFDKSFICVNQTYPSIINIYNNNVLKNCLTLSNQASNSIISQKNNCIIIKSLLINGMFEICFIDKNSYICLFQSTCETIEEDDISIKLLIRKFENSNYAQIISYDTINQKSTTETILLSKNNSTHNSIELLCYKFILAIQNNDIKMIKTLCSNNVSNKLTTNVIEHLFGEILKVYHDPFTMEQPTFILHQKNAIKKINFIIENDKIQDFNIFD